jgi:sulfide:quinone oxidoreductase
LFGRAASAHVREAYRDAVKPDVSLVRAVIRSLDPVAKTVETDVGTFASDVLVVALGADLDRAARPDLRRGGHEF